MLHQTATLAAAAQPAARPARAGALLGSARLAGPASRKPVAAALPGVASAAADHTNNPAASAEQPCASRRLPPPVTCRRPRSRLPEYGPLPSAPPAPLSSAHTPSPPPRLRTAVARRRSAVLAQAHNPAQLPRAAMVEAPPVDGPILDNAM